MSRGKGIGNKDDSREVLQCKDRRSGREVGEWDGRRGRGRRSKDKKVNREGRYLVEALEEAGWFIFNEGGKGDEEGEWTYAGGERRVGNRLCGTG